jgi:hypothetical protein
VYRATKESNEVDNDLMLPLARPGDIKGPEQLTRLMESFDTDGRRGVRERGVLEFSGQSMFGASIGSDIAYRLALGPVFVESHTVVESGTELI